MSLGRKNNKGRNWLRVRFREQVAPNKWQKKTKYFKVKRGKDAAKKYRGNGSIMSVTKASREKIHKIGGFFYLGERLLKEFANGDFVDKAVASRRSDGGNFFTLGDKLLEDYTRGGDVIEVAKQKRRDRILTNKYRG